MRAEHVKNEVNEVDSFRTCSKGGGGVMYLQQAEERHFEFGRDSVARELLPESLLDDFYLAREPSTGFFVGRERAVHFVNFHAKIESGLKCIHVGDDEGSCVVQG